MSFETWSKHSTRPALKSSWMLFSITPTKETNSGRFSVSKASITALTICWIHRTSTFIRTIPAAATHSTAITPSQRNSSSTVCVTGFEIRTLMDSVLMRDRFCRVEKMGGPWFIHRSCGKSNSTKSWRSRNSLPRPGMPPACIRLGDSQATVGRNGTAAFGTTCGVL